MIVKTSGTYFAYVALNSFMRYYIPLLAITTLLCSCAPRLYYPDRANVPGFTEANEMKVNISAKIQTNGPLTPASDFAYAPINHLGLMASYRTIDDRDAYMLPTYDKTSNYDYTNRMARLNGHRWEGGVGYFTKLEKKGLFETYGGYGNGSLSADNQPNHYFDTRYHRFFLQAEAGVKTRAVSFTGGLQASMHRYYAFRGDSLQSFLAGANNPYPFVPLEGQDFWFIQPFVNTEVGYKYVFFNFQLGFMGQLGGSAKDISGDSFMYISMGVSCRLDGHVFGRMKATKTEMPGIKN